jgi:hypothetical protein
VELAVGKNGKQKDPRFVVHPWQKKFLLFYGTITKKSD